MSRWSNPGGSLYCPLVQSTRSLIKKLGHPGLLSRLLPGPGPAVSASRPGLILIQIDGLSHDDFKRGIARGRLPFLRRLLRQRRYVSRPLYSGLPAATPAVQAELFYGIRTAVPAFAFLDRDTDAIRHMSQPGLAARIEKALQDTGARGLLRGGSSYADNFTGGARESHFCTASLRASSLMAAINPFKLGRLILAHPVSVLRIVGLLPVELLFGIRDFLAAMADRGSFLRELKFIPVRVGASILLREVCVIGGRIDTDRGLPIIHMNFIGYDEQSHRRGPDSLFAQWTLKGIDYAIRRVWRSAVRARRRHYHLWVYSDHGQCKASPYQRVSGYPLSTAVARAWSRVAGGHTPSAVPDREHHASQPYLPAGHYSMRWLWQAAGYAGDPDLSPAVPGRPFRIAAAGPVGFIYLDEPPAVQLSEALAEELVNRHRIPAAIVPDPTGALIAFTAAGRHPLPEGIGALCGPEHPWLEAVCEDLAPLCRHRNAGDITLLGWRHGAAPLTFAVENGAHGGISPRETGAFALLPADAPMHLCSMPLIRPSDLRLSAQALLAG